MRLPRGLHLSWAKRDGRYHVTFHLAPHAGDAFSARADAREMPIALRKAAALTRRVLESPGVAAMLPTGIGPALAVTDRLSDLAARGELSTVYTDPTDGMDKPLWQHFGSPILRSMARQLARSVDGGAPSVSGPQCLVDGCSGIDGAEMGWSLWHAIHGAIHRAVRGVEHAAGTLEHAAIKTLKTLKGPIEAAAVAGATALAGPIGGQIASSLITAVSGSGSAQQAAQQLVQQATQQATSNPAVAQALDQAHSAVATALTNAIPPAVANLPSAAADAADAAASAASSAVTDATSAVTDAATDAAAAVSGRGGWGRGGGYRGRPVARRHIPRRARRPLRHVPQPWGPHYPPHPYVPPAPNYGPWHGHGGGPAGPVAPVDWFAPLWSAFDAPPAPSSPAPAPAADDQGDDEPASTQGYPSPYFARPYHPSWGLVTRRPISFGAAYGRIYGPQPGYFTMPSVADAL